LACERLARLRMLSPRNERHRWRFGCAIGEHLRCCQRANVPSGATCRQTKIFVRPLNCRFLLDSQPWSTSAILGPSPDRRGCALTRRVYADSISEESSSHSSSSLVRDARKSGERRAESGEQSQSMVPKQHAHPASPATAALRPSGDGENATHVISAAPIPHVLATAPTGRR
jgi:hypothetical protein